MTITKKVFSIMLLSSAIISCSTQHKEINPIDQLYNQMTQEERIAQLHGIHLEQFFNDSNQLDTNKCKALLSNGVGHFSQFAVTQRKTPDQLRDMVEQMQQWLIHNTPNGIPALFHEEVLSGIASYEATVYPQQIGLACSFNPELAEKKTYQTATSLRKIGGCLALSPMVDIIRNPSFNRLEESYGEDAYLSSVMGVAFVKGLQHDDLSNGIAACTKHFLGYGGGGNAEEKELIEEILMPHETIIRLANSKVIMTGYHAIRDTKCVANTYIQKSILRDYLHFDGLTVSDYGSIDQLSEKDAIHRAAAAINAGNDVDFPDGDSYRYLQEAIQQKLVKQETLESAVKRVLKLKKELGLLNKKEQFGASGHIQFDTPEERQTAYQLASQSVVMLRNNGVLPIKESKKIALVGPNANSMWAMLGDYSYHSMRYFWQLELEDDMHPHIVSLKEGLTNKLPQGFSLQYSRGCDWTEKVETIIEDAGDERAAYMKSIQNRKIDSGEEANADEAIRLAVQSDVIIAAMGENVILCGENRDRLHLRLPGEQEQFVEKLIATGKPVVLILFGGRAQVISGIAEKCAAIIQAWYPGEEGGNALADILYGNISPSGKLSVSYPAQELHEPICYNYGLNNDPRIAYPFGYGLSYTTFKYDHLQMENQASILTDRFNVSCEITNTGSVAADEIVQLYLSPIDHPEHFKPIQLQGFKRVSLQPGETKEVHFAVSPHQFSYYNNGEWTIDRGKYQIKIGASSSDIRLSGEIELIGEPQKMPLRTNYFAE
ncbi:MAG: glycoside hydrolase family 3 C-terminal domain-containing protein [Paludibacteraceae bacterium]|nr:glycoside hydrolase family 3 C-terminal domain-containing protein [Paludibacteraceae bacterium]